MAHTALGAWRLRSSGAHCIPKLAKRIGEEEREKEEKEEEEDQLALIKSSNPHLAGGE